MRENYSRVLHRAREIAAEMKRQRDAENEAAHQRFLERPRLPAKLLLWVI